MIDSVEYSYVDSEQWVTLTRDGEAWQLVDLDSETSLALEARGWIAEGNTPAPCSTGMTLVPAPAAPEAVPQNAVLFDHENRLRTMEGTPPLTLEDFVTHRLGKA